MELGRGQGRKTQAGRGTRSIGIQNTGYRIQAWLQTKPSGPKVRENPSLFSPWAGKRTSSKRIQVTGWREKIDNRKNPSFSRDPKSQACSNCLPPFILALTLHIRQQFTLRSEDRNVQTVKRRENQEMPEKVSTLVESAVPDQARKGLLHTLKGFEST